MCPVAPRRPCRKLGCPALTDTGYCEAHQSLKHEASRQFDANRGNSSERGYDAHWRKFRAWVLRRRVMCEAKRLTEIRPGNGQHKGLQGCSSVQTTRLEISAGCNKPGAELHHIVRLQDGGDKYDETNIQVLCKSHHSSLRGQGGRA
jgi:hypothetical protein